MFQSLEGQGRHTLFLQTSRYFHPSRILGMPKLLVRLQLRSLDKQNNHPYLLYPNEPVVMQKDNVLAVNKCYQSTIG